MLLRLIILHIVLAALLVAGWYAGFLPVLWQADKFLAIPIIGCLLVAGIYMASRNAIEGCLWLADKLPVVGLALTVSGLLWAANAGLDAEAFKRALVDSLVGNLMGIVGYAWLELVVKVTRPEVS